MNNGRFRLSRRAMRSGLALLAAALLLGGGAAWRGIAAEQATQPKADGTVTVAPAVGRGIAAGRDSYADIVKIVAPAVVTIRVEGKATAAATEFQDDDFFRRFFGDQFDQRRIPRIPRSFRQRGLGSGVVIGADGYILTNYHVVDNADNIRVELADGRSLTAKVVGTDKPSDLALLKVEASGLHALALGNSDAVQVGDVVLAVGNPLGVGQTVTMGIVSAKGRSTGTGDGGYEDFLQTDAPINHGNSGGALVNTKGELVGINSQILSNTGENIGIGFAIPANMARKVVDDLRKEGRVRRAQLGVTVQRVTSDIAASLGLKDVGGAIISGVEPGSAAERAGLKQGDVIQTFNGQRVQDTNTLRNRVAEMQPGSSATVGIIRDGASRDVTVKLDEASASRSARRSSEPSSDDKTALGVSVTPVTPDVASRFRLPNNIQGLVVEDVDPDGRAADAGIQTGDVIQEANRRPVRTVDELRTAVRSGSDKPLLLLVSRDGRNLFLTVRPAA
jgi:Do/DeqQ family serine protease